MADSEGFKSRWHVDNLTGEHILADAVQIILFILFMAVWITDAFFCKYLTLLNGYIPNAVKVPIGIVILIVAGGLRQYEDIFRPG